MGCAYLIIILLQATIAICDKPNLVIIITDEHNLRTLGCYRSALKGSSLVWGKGVKVETPHLDSLAEDGAIFTNFNAVAPLCTPSRASFMSGLYPKFTGAWKNHQPMNENTTTFAEILQKSGYHTGYIGKWHLNGAEKPGFSNKERPFGFSDIKYQFNRGHWKLFEEDLAGDIHYYGWKNRHKVKNITGAYATDFLFSKAIKFIENQIYAETNFALMLSILDPHGPNNVRPPYDKMFDEMSFKLPMTAVAAYHKKPASPRWSYVDSNIKHAEQTIMDTENSYLWQTKLRQYFGMVKLIDDKVGELLSVLKEHGKDEDTIVVFTSDHGDMLGEHAKFNKGRPYLTSAGVPFIVRYPKRIMRGKKIKTACTSPDFAPTILSLMDIDHSDIKFQGIDMSGDLFDNVRVKKRRQVRFITDSKKAKWAAAVDREFKLVLSKSDPPILFDLRKDPNELKNFYGSSGYVKVSNQLEQSLSVAMIEYRLPLASAKSIWVNQPVCFDTKDQIPYLPKQVCRDLIIYPDIDECVSDNVKSFCPNACGLCCQDSDGFILYQGISMSCKDIKRDPSSHCADKKISIFCPVTCSICKHDPSLKPSMSQLLNFPLSNKSTREPTSILTSIPSSETIPVVSSSPSQIFGIPSTASSAKRCFDPITLSDDNFQTKALALYDIDGNGFIDLLFGNKNEPNHLMLNNGNRTFKSIFLLDEGESKTTESIALADMDSNGFVDLVVGNFGGSNQVIWNNGHGSFDITVDLPGGVMNTEAITLADMDGDGIIDIVIGNDDQPNQVVKNYGNGMFAKAIELPGNKRTVAIAVADLDGNSFIDIVTGNVNEANQVLLYDKEAVPVIYDLPGSNMNTRAIILADMDDDGFLDIVVGNFDQPNQIIWNKGELRRVGKGVRRDIYELYSDLPGGNMNTEAIALFDLNNDGNLDIVVGNRDQPNQIILNRGNQTFDEPINLPGGNQDTHAIAVADINGDGLNDIVIGNVNEQTDILIALSVSHGRC